MRAGRHGGSYPRAVDASGSPRAGRLIPGARIAGFGLLALLLAVPLAACSKSTPPRALPAASSLLSLSSSAMSSVTSAHFSLNITGPAVTSVPLSSATGDMDRNGDVQASANVTELGLLINAQVIITGGTVYLRLGSGKYTTEPASSFYNPSQLLDPNQGVAALLSQGTNGKTLGQESIQSTPAYKVQATVPTAVLSGLTDLAPGQDTVSATLWIAVTGSRLLQAVVPFKVPGAKTNTVVTATLSQFNAPVSVKAPSTS